MNFHRFSLCTSKDVAFIQGQGASNSSSSSTTSTTGASTQQQQQQNDALKTNNNMDTSESTPNLTHATRVSPATVRHRFFMKMENVFLFVCWCEWRKIFSIFFFLYASLPFYGKKFLEASLLSDFPQQ
jgi:hypothetical protein